VVKVSVFYPNSAGCKFDMKLSQLIQLLAASGTSFRSMKSLCFLNECPTKVPRDLKHLGHSRGAFS
jgi:hypothetical protein